jgi:archaeal flagellin N-terminal-like domain
MMKLKKSMKNRSAVSPVIATILMVAITVVLAAVLYVMVMGFGSSPTNNATGSIGPATETSYGYNVPINSISSSDIKISDCKVNILVNGTAGSALTLTTDADHPITVNGFEIVYQDVDGNGKISGGDSISVSGTFPTDSSIEVRLLGANAQIAVCTINT